MEILIPLIIGVVLMELYLWLDPLARWLVHRAAKQLPEDRQAEFTSEWEGNLAAVPNSIVKVIYVLRDCVLPIMDIQQIMSSESLEETETDRDEGRPMSKPSANRSQSVHPAKPRKNPRTAGLANWEEHLKEVSEPLRKKITDVLSTNRKSAHPLPVVLKIGENVDGTHEVHIRTFMHNGHMHIGLNVLRPNTSLKK